MKKFSVFIVFTFLILLSSCTNINSKKADIVTTMYVQYDIAKVIVEDKLSISLIVPTGAEVHSYEPSSRDIEAVKKSKLFIYTSLDIDTWIKDPTTIGGPGSIVLDLSKSYHHDESNHEDSHEHEHDHSDDIHDHGGIHYWTDPIIYIELIEAILDKVIEVDSKNSELYIKNASDYIAEIEELHHALDDYIKTNDNKKIYFAGHNAMSAFGERYGIDITALSNTSNPDADTTPAQLTKLIQEIEVSNTKYLFIEELKEPRIARTIQSELEKKGYHLELLLLHGYHNVSKDDFNNNVRYADLLRVNIENIKKALGE